MKYQPKYQVGERVQYNSLSSAGAAHGTIESVNNDELPHVYKVKPDLFRESDVLDTVKEQDIYSKI